MFASGAEEERERQGLFVAVDCLLVCWLVVFFCLVQVREGRV